MPLRIVRARPRMALSVAFFGLAAVALLLDRWTALSPHLLLVAVVATVAGKALMIAGLYLSLIHI